jgi:poly(A) polymerase
LIKLRAKIEAEAVNILGKISRFLNGKQIDAYLVGGFVRNLLIGRPTADIDIAISDDALSVASQIAAETGGKYVELDSVNRMARVVFSNESGSGKKKLLYIDFSSISGDILQDLARRDFKMDAMGIELDAYLENPENFELIDPFNGQGDLKKRVIECVSEGIFEDDPARLLRAVRMAAEFDFKISAATESLIKKSSSLVKTVAGERIKDELLRILTNPKAGYFVRYLDFLGLLTSIIPELEYSRGVEQPKEHHWDVLNHSLETVRTTGFLLKQEECDYASPHLLDGLFWNDNLTRHFSLEVSSTSTRTSLLKLAALLHDVAKPETKIMSKERVRFFGHTEKGADLVITILERLRFSNREIKLVETMVRYHMRPNQMSNQGMPSRKAIYRFFRDSGLAGLDVLFLSLADHLAARGPDLDLAQWNRHVEQVNYILVEYFRQKSIITPVKLLDGYDLIKLFNLQPGPEIREILDAVKEAQVTGKITTREAALSYVENRLLYKG